MTIVGSRPPYRNSFLYLYLLMMPIISTCHLLSPYCLRVIQQSKNRKLKNDNCWQQTSLKEFIFIFLFANDAYYFHVSFAVTKYFKQNMAGVKVNIKPKYILKT